MTVMPGKIGPGTKGLWGRLALSGLCILLLTDTSLAQSARTFPGWQATGAPRTIRPADQAPAAVPDRASQPLKRTQEFEPEVNQTVGGTIARAPVLDRSGGVQPAPALQEDALASSEPLRRPQIRMGEISAIDGASVSLVSGDEALSGDLWSQADAVEMARLLDQIEPHPTSRVLNRLMTRLLLSGGSPPSGQREGFVQARVNALLRFGQPGDASRLVAAVGGQSPLSVNAALLNGDFDGACSRGNAQSAEEIFFLEVAIWCAARAGDEAAALLDMDLMRETGSADPLFIALMDRQLFGAAVDIPPYTGLEPLHLAMLAGQGALPDVSGDLPSAYIPLLADQVQDPVDKAVLVVEAWRLGAASVDQVAAALAAVPNALKGPMAQKYSEARSSDAELGSFWIYGAQRDRFPLTAALSANTLSALTPGADTGTLRYGAVQALTATGQLRRAYEWFEISPELSPIDPVSEAHITALLVLSDSQATLAAAGDLEKILTNRARGGDKGADRMLRLIRVLENSPGRITAMPVGETILRTHLSLQNASLSKTSAKTIADAAAALLTADLEDQARMLAVEAALTPPYLTSGS